MAIELSELDRFDAERPAPPPLLYKYVTPARLDVLQNASIRFTPPLNTNDIFEVRQTFDLIAGPKMHGYFTELSKTLDFEDSIANVFKTLGLESIPDEQKRLLLSSVLGPTPKGTLRDLFGHLLDGFLAKLNDPKNVDDVLYHDSFDNNGDEVTEKLADAIRNTPKAISPLNLSGTVGLLKDLAWPGDIHELIQGYISARADDPEQFWNLEDSAFGDEVVDPGSAPFSLASKA